MTLRRAAIPPAPPRGHFLRSSPRAESAWPQYPERMQDVHTLARRQLGRLLVAGLVVDPLGQGLTRDELKGAAIESGMSPAVFTEVITEFWEERTKSHADQTIRAGSNDLTLLGAMNGHRFPPVLPMSTIPRVEGALTRLEQRLGVKTAKSLEAILSECADPPDDVKLALGILLTHEHVERAGDGFRRRLPGGGSFGTNAPDHPESQALNAAIRIMEGIMAIRSAEPSSAMRPIDRFHAFLEKQGWNGLVGWWAATAQETAGLWDHYPSAATVLAGALLEAALVAIAEPAKAAGEWNHKFLKDDPRTWQLRDLIKQAEAAGTFSPNGAAHARTLADLRNRIHAGRFATAGPDPFRPPHTNAHEAHVAKLHLDFLLTAILEWKPIATLV